MIEFARPDLTGNERKYLNECIDTNHVTHIGRFVGDFEKAFSERFGKPSIATSSGTAALHIALLSLGIGHGDEVLVPDLTFGTTASVVMATGAKPVFVDIDPATWCLSKDRALAAVCKRTRAAIPVHLYGLDAGDFSELGVPIIEDACEALGIVPMRGAMTAYSFFGNKTITTGEGGMLCGNFGNAKLWRDGGFTPDYRFAVPGLNYRMSNMQAALGLAQFERFDYLANRRARNAQRYADALHGKGRWLFVAEVTNPALVRDELLLNGISSRPVFCPLHRSPAFSARGKFEYSDYLWRHGIVLPTGPHLTDEQIEKIIEVVNVNCNLRGSPHVRSRVPAPV